MPTQARDHLSTKNVSQQILSSSQPGQDKISGPASSNPGPPSEVISTQSLQSSAADREAERER